MDLKQIRTDEDKEVNGVWETLDGITRVKIARFGNRKMNAFYAKYPRVLRNRIDSDESDDDTNIRVTCEVMANTILLDWENLYQDGKKIDYSTDKAFEILLAEKEFRSLIWELCQQAALFHVKSVEKSIKNLPSDSDMTSPTTVS